MEDKHVVKVSIIVPVFNMEKYLQKCIDSLLNQTLREIEVVLINDRSSDLSGSICEEYKRKDSRVVLHTNHINIKQGMSINIGIKYAKGDFICFMGADDWVDLDYYEKLYLTAKKYNLDIVKAELAMYTEGKRLIRNNKTNQKIKKGLLKKQPMYTLFTDEYTTALFRREMILKHNIAHADIRNGQDIIFLLQATYYAKSISLIKGKYYYYRQHQKSTTHVRNIPYFDSTLQCFRLHVDFVNSKNIDREGYDFLFFRGLIGVTKRFPLFKDRPDLVEYQNEYVKKTIDIILDYKYDDGVLLKYLLQGLIKQQQLERINNSMTFNTLRAMLKLGRFLKK